MRLIAANGIFILVPSVLFLAWKAGHGEFDAAFVAVQIVEFAAGSLNLALMGLNIRDGLRLTRRLGPRRAGRLAPEPDHSSHSVMNVPFSWMSVVSSGPGPGLVNLCGVLAGTTINCPALARICWEPTVKSALPVRTTNVSG